MKAVLFSLFVLLSLKCATSVAELSSTQNKYYGEQFHRDLASGVSGVELKKSLHEILHGAHIRGNDTWDQITQDCSGSRCYRHISLGYDRARISLLGNFYLVDQGRGRYALKDVYCDKLRPQEDFKDGSPPAPNTIPGGSTVNTEHTWPQSRFSSRYNRDLQKSDMHHLYPTDNQMNSIRGNNPFGEVVKDRMELRCKASRFGRSSRGGQDVFEPPANHRGNVARSLFYFAVRYEMEIDANQEATLRAWSKQDPIDEEEVRRNEYIYKMQGNRNPFIDFPYLEEGINNF